MKILLLSSYNTPSHSYWSNLLIKSMSDYNWTYLNLPPRKFSWRIRGNPLSWMAEEAEILKKDYHTLLVTSMVDLATIVGLFPNLAKANKIYYFHENQFDYPLSMEKHHSNVESMMVNLYGALAADKVVFNSNYNRDSFFSGATRLLKRINDHSPVSVLDIARDKSQILPVPICIRDSSSMVKIPNSLIWNHRWEYDKNPQDYYEALKILKSRGVDFKLIFMGIQFKSSPEVFKSIEKEFQEEIICWGQQTKEDYLMWLKRGQFIVSTAIHEFQGLAVMEGVQMGAIPIVPNRLSYPQWFPEENLFGNTPLEMANYMEKSFKTPGILPDITSLTWENLEGKYRNLLETVKSN